MKLLRLNSHTPPPQELMLDTSPGNFWKTLIIACAVVFLLNIASSHLLDLYSPNTGYRLIGAKWDILAEIDSPVDVLVLGDSSGAHGIDTDFLAKKTGKSVLNLSTIAGLLSLNDYWQLKNYIARFGAPGCVIAVHAFDVWYRHAKATAIAQIPLNPIEMVRELQYVHLGLKFLAKYLVARYFPSLAEKTSLQQLLMYPWKIKKQHFHITDTGFFPLSHAKPDTVLKDTEGLKKFLRKNKFKPSEENNYALKSMGELAKRNGFPLVIVNGPMFAGLYEDTYLKHYLADVNHFLFSIVSKYDDMHHLFETPVTFDSSEIEFTDHLTGQSARTYTAQLIEKLDCDL